MIAGLLARAVYMQREQIAQLKALGAIRRLRSGSTT